MYARLPTRIRALLIDSIVLTVVFVLSVLLVSIIAFENEYTGTIIAFIPVIIIEPLMLYFLGGTVGHNVLGLRVCSSPTGNNLNLFAASIRTILKLILGFPSLVFVLTTRKHQAIHDLASNAVVIVKDIQNKPSYMGVPERVKDENYHYPSAGRRVLISLAYLLSFLIAISVLMVVVISDSCLKGDTCTSFDSIAYLAIEVSFCLVLFAIPALGWTARLFGARKMPLT